jgi:hypothetical protein
VTRIELTELLHSRPISHPTRIISTSIEPGSLRLVLQGYPWWRDVSGQEDDASIVFLFEGIRGGQLCIENFANTSLSADEALETFEVCSLTELDWAQPNRFSVYCSGSLENPLKLYWRVHDFLGKADAYRRTSEFLNYPSGQLAQFVETTSSGSYLIGSGPESIRSIICEELEKQGVAYNIIESKMAPARGLLVRLAMSDFVCAEAFAEFEE